MTTHPITHDPAAVDNDTMFEWMHVMNDCTAFLNQTSWCHNRHDHLQCEDARRWLQSLFGVTRHEAEVLIASFAQVMSLPEEQALRMAGRFAAYFEQEG